MVKYRIEQCVLIVICFCFVLFCLSLLKMLTGFRMHRTLPFDGDQAQVEGLREGNKDKMTL